MIFNKYGPCRGIKLFQWLNRLVEIWYVPRSYEIPAHSHPEENIELMFLFGQATFYMFKNGELIVFEAKPKHIFRRFTVPASCPHWFTTYNTAPLIFINFSKWLNGKIPTSAAIDFKSFCL